MFYADSALILADKLKYEKGIAYAYYNLGRLDEAKGNYSEAISKATESQKYAERAIENYNIFKIILGLGLLLGALLLMVITKRIFSWKKQKEK